MCELQGRKDMDKGSTTKHSIKHPTEADQEIELICAIIRNGYHLGLNNHNRLSPRERFQFAVKHGVHPNQVSQWKSQAIAGMEDIFERPNKKSQEVRQQEEKGSEYLKTIGKQKVEIEFLKKKYRQLYGEEPPQWIT